jgi:bifunctional non-homologous end joining protein LigD
MHARLDRGQVQILTRRGLNWTAKYPTIAEAVAALAAGNAYLDGELCGVLPDGRTAFNLIQNATETSEGLVYFVFDLLFLDGEDLRSQPLTERKERLAALLKAGRGVYFCTLAELITSLAKAERCCTLDYR